MRSQELIQRYIASCPNASKKQIDAMTEFYKEQEKQLRKLGVKNGDIENVEVGSERSRINALAQRYASVAIKDRNAKKKKGKAIK